MASTKDKRERYGVEKLSPMLELMVSDILREQPADPKAFMKQWLGKPPTDGKCFVDVLREQMAQFQTLEGPPDMAALAAAKPEVQIAAAGIVSKSIVEGCRMAGEFSLRATAEAPFIHQFFEVVGAITEEVMLANEYESMFDGPEGMQLYQQEKIVAKMERIQTEGPPLLAKSFRHHDSDGDDVLNRDEAAKFFAHVVSEEGPFMEMVVSACNVKFLNVMRMMSKEEREEMGGMADGEAGFKNFPEKMEKMKAAYLANKAVRDAAAFSVCDTNGDGTLQLDEVVAALMPGSEKNDAFIKALGFKSMAQDMLKAMANFQCSD